MISRSAVLPRWKWIDCFLPFWSDRDLRWYYKRYKFVSDEELGRKLAVCRESINRGHRKDSFERKQEVLWAIETGRGKARHRSERRAELRAWIMLLGAVGVVGMVVKSWDKIAPWLEGVRSSIFD